MATISWKLLKTGALVGSVPAVGIYVGYQMRSNLSLAGRTEQSRVYAVQNIPVYNTSNNDTYNTPSAEIYPRDKWEAKIGSVRMTVQDGLQFFKTCVVEPVKNELYPRNTAEPVEPEPYPRNELEESIAVYRLKVEEFIASYSETYEMIQDKFNIGVSHSQATVDYIQNDNNEVVRIVSITVAGLGGMVLGYRGSIIRKMFYASITGGSMASLCYPKKTVELSQQAYEGLFSLYDQLTNDRSQDDIIKIAGFVGYKIRGVLGEELKDDKAINLVSNDAATEINDTAKVLSTKVQAVKGDPGQSNPEDKDMYSTRSS